MLGSDGDVLHVIVVLDGKKEENSDVADKLFAAAAKRRVHRIFIHVVSPLPAPLYLEKLKGLLKDNLAYTVVLKHEGGKPEDLRELLRCLPGPPCILVRNGSRDFTRILEENAMHYELL